LSKRILALLLLLGSAFAQQAGQKISQLPSGNPAQSGDLIPIARGSANYSLTAGSISALNAANGPTGAIQFNAGSGVFEGVTTFVYVPSTGGISLTTLAGDSFAVGAGTVTVTDYAGNGLTTIGANGTATLRAAQDVLVTGSESTEMQAGTVNETVTTTGYTFTNNAFTVAGCASGSYIKADGTGCAIPGGVSSVAQTVPSWLTVTGSPVTTSGTLAIAAATGQTPHEVIGTCGSATSFAPCALVAGDLPTIPSSQVSGLGALATLANGGTISGYTWSGGTLSGTIGGTPTFSSTQTLSTSGNAGTATDISTNGTSNQVWGMNSVGSAQGWQTLAAGGLSGMTAGQVPIAATATTVTSSEALAGTGEGIVTGPTSVTSGDLASFTGTTGQIADSSVIAANVTTQTSNGAVNQVCTYTGANKVCVPGAVANAALANDAITIAGTSVALGGSTSSLPSPGAIGGTTAAAGTFTTLTANTSLTINGGTAITSASSANPQVVTCPTGGTGTQVCDASGAWISPGSGTTTNSLTGNNSGSGATSGSTFNGSAAVTFSYNTFGAAPTASPTFTGTVTTPLSTAGLVTTTSGGALGSEANATIAQGGTNATSASAGTVPNATSGTAASWTSTPALGASGTAGTLALYPASGNFTTTLGSAATASNAVNFFASVPTNLHTAYCAVSSTTCTLTDTGYAYNAIPFADLTGVASSGSNSNITSLSGLTTPLTAGQGGTGVANTATLTLGTSNRNYATLGTGFEYNTTTTGAVTDATAAQLGVLINLAQYDLIASGGTSSAPVGISAGALGTFLSGQGASANPSFVTLSAINPQTSTYQVTATDFSSYKTITVASGTFTITLVASGSQPPAGQYINVINYGSGTVTIARSGQNINGATSSLTLSPGSSVNSTGATIWSDGANYFASVDEDNLNTGTVTSIATTSPITGGTITTTGTIACATCATTTNGGAISFDKSNTGLINPTADATFTEPGTSTTGLTLAGTAPSSVSTSTGTAATTLFNVNGVAGGATSNATGTGGVGSAPTITGGQGGAGTGTNAIGGAGGAVTITAGAGGASNGTGINANGGNVVAVPGAAGTGGSGTAGKAGVFQVGSSAPFPVAGSGGGSMAANGSAPTGLSGNSGWYANSANSCFDILNGTSDLGCALGTASTIPINSVVSATGAIATIANGNNPLTINCALTSGATCLTTGETTAATTAGAVEHQITTLTTTTAIPLQITQGAAGPAAANAPAVLNVSAAAAGGAASASINGLTGAPITLLTGAGSAGGATTGNGGTGGAFTVTLGNGGAHGGTTTNTGGTGGAFALTSGAGTQGAATGAGGAAGTLTVSGAAGGAGGATSGTGGAGSDFLITTGTGGAATSGSTTGRGGNAVFTLGSAGGTGTAGAPGQFEITAGTVGAANTTPFLNLTGTWNTTGVVNAGIFENITNTASGSGSSLMTLEASNTSEFALNSQASSSFALGPNMVLGGTAPEITLGGTTPYLSIPAVHGTFNACHISTAVTLTSTTTICSWTLPAAAITWSYHCSGTWSTSTSTISMTLGTQFADAPTNSSHNAIIWTAASTQTYGTASNTGTTAVTTMTGGSLSSGTNVPWQASGTFTGSATSGTFVIYGTASTSSDASIAAGSSCYLF
jgi:hypothetical protein